MLRYVDDNSFERRYDEIGDQFTTDPVVPVRAPTSLGSADINGEVTLDPFTADQNDLSLPEGFSFRLSTDGLAARTITGFANVQAARVVYIHNVAGGQNILIAHQSASSSAENRVIARSAATLTVGPDQTAGFIYDSRTTRWRQICP